jgi:hypothetical protein
MCWLKSVRELVTLGSLGGPRRGYQSTDFLKKKELVMVKGMANIYDMIKSGLT